jgi:Phage minor structural protein GP20.
MDWLKNILQDINTELTEEQAEEFQKKLALAFVPKKEFNSKIDEIKELKSKTEQFKNEHENLQKQYEELNSNFLKSNGEISGYEERLEKMSKTLYEEKLQSKLYIDLILSKAKNPVTAIPLLDLSKISLDEDGNLNGLSDQLEEIKEHYSYLFLESTEEKITAPNVPFIGSKGNFPRKSKQINQGTLNHAIETYLNKKY